MPYSQTHDSVTHYTAWHLHSIYSVRFCIIYTVWHMIQHDTLHTVHSVTYHTRQCDTIQKDPLSVCHTTVVSNCTKSFTANPKPTPTMWHKIFTTTDGTRSAYIHTCIHITKCIYTTDMNTYTPLILEVEHYISVITSYVCITILSQSQQWLKSPLLPG